MFGTNKIFLTNRARHQAIWAIWESVLMTWYSAGLGRLPDNVQITDPGLVTLIIRTIIGAIVVGSIIAIVLRFRLPKEAADERDRLYEALAYKKGFFAMIISTILLIGYLFASHVAHPWLDPDFMTFTPVNITFVLFFILLLGDMVRRISLMRYYKRGE